MHSKLALITFLDGSGGSIDNTLPQPGLPVDPGYGVPGGGGHPWFPGHGGINRPDQGLPGGGAHPWFPAGGSINRPSQGLPGGGHISGQPIPPGHASGQPIVPPPPLTADNTLPTPPPGTPVTLPVFPADPMTKDQLFELKFSAAYGWCVVPFDEDAPVAAPKK
jgi:hypothetical protein